MRNTKRLMVGTSALALLLLSLPPPAAAETFHELSFKDLVQTSDLIVVGVVSSVDEAYGASTSEAMTRIDMKVERVLRGSGPQPGETFAILHRGGVRADGLGERWSSAVSIAAQDKYVFFVQREFYVMPFVPSSFSVMRVVDTGEREVIATKAGQLLSASPTIGLMVGQAAADSLGARLAKRLEGSAERVEAVEGVSDRHDAARVFALIEQVAKTLPQGQRVETATRPQALPASMTTELVPASNGTTVEEGKHE